MRRSLLGTILIAGIAFGGTATVPTSAEAQSFSQYCHDRAQRLSGYRGRPGGAVGGAIEGAIGGAVISGILGGSKRDRRKAAKIGALLGGISKSNRPNSRGARIYRLEYDECMRRR